MNVVVLLAGTSDDFLEKGHSYPKYLLEIQNKPIIQRVVESLDILGGKVTFVIRKEDNDKFYFGNTLKILSPQSNVVEVESMTKGAVCTALFAIEKINNDNELLIVNGDQLIKADLGIAIEEFKNKKLDGGILTFQSVHPRWSYVLLNEEGLVIQTSEKRPISNMATAGFYYYKKGSDFVKAAMAVIEKDVNINGIYYISSTYNELILENKEIGVFEIPRKDYISFANYQLYENFMSQRRGNND